MPAVWKEGRTMLSEEEIRRNYSEREKKVQAKVVAHSFNASTLGEGQED